MAYGHIKLWQSLSWSEVCICGLACNYTYGRVDNLAGNLIDFLYICHN